MRKILVLDNYDSFTYNLVHILHELGRGSVIDVFRNDKIELDEVDYYDDILLSPGPGVPKDAGIMPELIKQFGSSKNILGVCLGHQAIGEAYGSELFNLPDVLHGIVTNIDINKEDKLFRDIPPSFDVCRYHSWVIKEDSLPDELEVLSTDGKGQIMAVKHKEFKVRGVQFHPESVMTQHGKKLIENWLSIGE